MTAQIIIVNGIQYDERISVEIAKTSLSVLGNGLDTILKPFVCESLFITKEGKFFSIATTIYSITTTIFEHECQVENWLLKNTSYLSKHDIDAVKTILHLH